MTHSDQTAHSDTATTLHGNRHTIKVTYDNHDATVTEINGTVDSVLDYYIGKQFNLGTDGDKIVTAVKVAFFDGEVFLTHKRQHVENHRHYELARRAHYNTSFSPEKRAEGFCSSFDNTIAYLENLGIEAAKIAKYESLAVAHLQAKSRCISSMITGPANFPVARAEKANRAEHARSEECSAYYDKIVKEAEKEKYYAANPEARPVASSDVDAVERLQAKLAALMAAQSKMVAANKLVRKGDQAGLVALLGQEVAETIMKPDFCGRTGYASFELTNNNAKIKATRERIAEIEKRKATTPQDITINGVRIVENTQDMRLQLFFEGKPAQAMIALLKSHAFKWSPRNRAWQRQLTNNAVYSFNHWVLPALKAQEAA